MKHIEPLRGTEYQPNTAKEWAVFSKLSEIIDALNSLTEKKLLVECECGYPESHAEDCSKYEPEKTAESEWEKELDLRLKNWQGDIYYWKHDMKDFIRNLLTSHTEQKKKELETKVRDLAPYLTNVSFFPHDEPKIVQTINRKDILHLIKEL